jgi:hypothetical protein
MLGAMPIVYDMSMFDTHDSIGKWRINVTEGCLTCST